MSTSREIIQKPSIVDRWYEKFGREAANVSYPNAFLTASEIVLEHEGYLTNDPDDPGGFTMWGIIQPTLKRMGRWGDVDQDGDVDVNDLHLLAKHPEHKEFARYIYYHQWWLRWKYDQIEAISVASTMLDLAVVLGQYQAARNMQRAIRCVIGCDVEEFDLVEIDGIMGPKTICEMNHIGKQFPNRYLELHFVLNAGTFQNNCYRWKTEKKKNPDKFLHGY